MCLSAHDILYMEYVPEWNFFGIMPVFSLPSLLGAFDIYFKKIYVFMSGTGQANL